MTKLWTTALGLVCGFACVTEVELESASRTVSGDVPAIDIDMIDPGEEPSACSFLPDDCGPCAVACDYAALREFVPPGTCAAFICTLTDGRRVTFHACHL